MNLDGLKSHQIVHVDVATGHEQYGYGSAYDPDVLTVTVAGVQSRRTYPVHSAYGDTFVYEGVRGWVADAGGHLSITITGSQINVAQGERMDLISLGVKLYAPSVSLSADKHLLSEESEDTATFTASRDLPQDWRDDANNQAVPPLDVPITVDTSGGVSLADVYAPPPANVNFGHNQQNATPFTIQARDDAVAEGKPLRVTQQDGLVLDGSKRNESGKIGLLPEGGNYEVATQPVEIQISDGSTWYYGAWYLKD